MWLKTLKYSHRVACLLNFCLVFNDPAFIERGILQSMNELVSTLYWTTDTDFGGFSECTLLDQCTSTFLRLREKKEDLSEVPDEHGQNKNHYCYNHPQNRSEAEG